MEANSLLSVIRNLVIRYFHNLYLKREKLKWLGKECLLILVGKQNV